MGVRTKISTLVLNMDCQLCTANFILLQQHKLLKFISILIVVYFDQQMGPGQNMVFWCFFAHYLILQFWLIFPQTREK